MSLGLRFVVLLACVPLLLAPDVCTCDDGDGRPRHEQHDHDHDCLGSLGLDYNDLLQSTPVFALPAIPCQVIDVLQFEEPGLAEVPLNYQLWANAVPRYLCHLSLLI